MQSVYILVGIVGAVIVFGAVSVFLDSYLGPWRKLAAAFPGQPVRDADGPDSGEAVLAWSKRRFSFERVKRHGGVLRALGWVALATALIGTVVVIVMLVGRGGGGGGSGSLWTAMWVLSGVGWSAMVLWFGARFLLAMKVFHRPVRYEADDEFLHLRSEGSGGVGSVRVSIPWAAIDALDGDAEMTRGGQAWTAWRVSWGAEERWAHGWIDLVERELMVRHEGGGAPVAGAGPAGGWDEGRGG